MRDDLEEPAARDRLRVAGYDPEAGTVPLTGKKACPVLEGDGVPTLDGFDVIVYHHLNYLNNYTLAPFTAQCGDDLASRHVLPSVRAWPA